MRGSRWTVRRRVVWALALTALLVLTISSPPTTLSLAALWSIAIAAIAMWVIRNSFPSGLLSAPGSYFLVLTVFHLGLAPTLAVGVKPPDLGNPLGASWVTQQDTAGALRVVSASLLGFAVAAIAFSRPRRGGSSVANAAHLAEARRTARLGLILASIGVGGWLLFVVSRAGLSALTGSYGSYLEQTQAGALPMLYLSIGFSAVLAAATPGRAESRMVVLLLGVFGLFGAFLGLRGELLFPAAAGAVVLVRQGRLRPSYRWALVGLLLLSSISVIRTVRQVGIRDAGSIAVDINPMNGLAEMGYSLRPVAEVLEWQALGEPTLAGRTYTQPLKRLVSTFISTVEVPSAEKDRLLMNVRVSQDVGPIGFSPVAEGYVNFGLTGSVAALALIGALLGILDRSANSTADLVLLGLVMVPLLINTRNSFVPVPLQLILAAGLWILVKHPGRRKGRPQRRPYPLLEPGT